MPVSIFCSKVPAESVPLANGSVTCNFLRDITRPSLIRQLNRVGSLPTKLVRIFIDHEGKPGDTGKRENDFQPAVPDSLIDPLFTTLFFYEIQFLQEFCKFYILSSSWEEFFFAANINFREFDSSF